MLQYTNYFEVFVPNEFLKKEEIQLNNLIEFQNGDFTLCLTKIKASWFLFLLEILRFQSFIKVYNSWWVNSHVIFDTVTYLVLLV